MERRPSIAVFGLYKSGTTALHYRIKGALDAGVRQLFEPTLYRRLPGDARNGVLAKVIVRPDGVRVPRVDYRSFLGFDRRLVLVRDPRDWLVSALLFEPQQRLDWLSDAQIERTLALLRRKEEDPASVSFIELWQALIGAGAGERIEHLKALSGLLDRLEGNHVVVGYEEMVAGRLEEAETYLGLDLGAEPRLPEWASHVPRTRSSGAWRDWFCAGDLETLRPMLSPFLERFGYEPDDWQLNPEPLIEVEHCSGYVERTVAKRRRQLEQKERWAIRGLRMSRSGPMRFEEDQLFPMEAVEPGSGPVLVLAPHPDDETFGCGGTIAQHRARGDAVRVVFVTSGELCVTDASLATDRLADKREAEAGAALSRLGVEDWEFWRQPDRSVVAATLVELIWASLREGGFRLVYAPAPTEPHPDHRAVAHGLREAVRRSGGDFDVSFYEVGAPTQINRLVAVDTTVEQKRGAMAAYEGRIEGESDRVAAVEGLSHYRALPLKGESSVAEGFRVIPAADLDADAIWGFSALQERGVGGRARASSISVIVRTKDRPRRLAEALASLGQQTISDFEVLLVNDGDTDPSPVLAGCPELDVTIVDGPGRGPGAALNAGLEASTRELIAYLDDDDVFYPDHLAELRTFLDGHSGFVAAYSDAYAAHYRAAGSGDQEQLEGRAVELSQDFDRELLLYRNYVPLITVMHRREAAERAGGFDEEMPMLEGWDFLIRLGRCGPLRHLRFPTAEYRIHSDGLCLSSDPGSAEAMQRAHGMIYERYRSERSAGVEARVFDRIYSEVGELRSEVARLAAAEERSRSASPPPPRPAEIRAETARLKARLRDSRARLAESRERLQRIQRSRWWRLRARLRRLRPGG